VEAELVCSTTKIRNEAATIRQITTERRRSRLAIRESTSLD
jgi:hypothetical protein